MYGAIVAKAHQFPWKFRGQTGLPLSWKRPLPFKLCVTLFFQSVKSVCPRNLVHETLSTKPCPRNLSTKPHETHNRWGSRAALPGSVFSQLYCKRAYNSVAPWFIVPNEGNASETEL